MKQDNFFKTIVLLILGTLTYCRSHIENDNSSHHNSTSKKNEVRGQADTLVKDSINQKIDTILLNCIKYKQELKSKKSISFNKKSLKASTSHILVNGISFKKYENDEYCAIYYENSLNNNFRQLDWNNAGQEIHLSTLWHLYDCTFLTLRKSENPNWSLYNLYTGELIANGNGLLTYCKNEPIIAFSDEYGPDLNIYNHNTKSYYICKNVEFEDIKLNTLLDWEFNCEKEYLLRFTDFPHSAGVVYELNLIE